jgi:hypothetical protein
LNGPSVPKYFNQLFGFEPIYLIWRPEKILRVVPKKRTKYFELTRSHKAALCSTKILKNLPVSIVKPERRNLFYGLNYLTLVTTFRSEMLQHPKIHILGVLVLNSDFSGGSGLAHAVARRAICPRKELGTRVVGANASTTFLVGQVCRCGGQMP